ncbi:galactokinase [Pedobacter sp. HMWF019]|uniref:galactokinase n=1 Tax=Pedobacter sp. HMWF019 TaxID=2056856 RepID=UPI000D3D5ADB|nr:galactokinase [Pedobacter sp. HMWF019]PTT02227.1 galactokinase [Pedobacter sp. HMWF019]
MDSKLVSSTVKVDVEGLKQAFKNLYGVDPLLVRSPGRINIIGEHTDYNEGFVMPAAIDKAIYIGISKREDDQVHLFAKDYEQTHTVALSALAPSEKGWPNYILGVADQLQKRGYTLGGFNLYIDGDVPLGAGLSSSAAVECATAYALDQLFSLLVAQLDLALIAQKAEHVFAGVSCGIMDQFASVFGKKDHAILLDCRSMEYEYLPLDLGDYKLLLLNTNVKHSLSDSAYNERRSQCERGVAWVKEKHPEVNSLRDVTLAMLQECVESKDRNVFVKCRFVVAEIERLGRAADFLKQGNLEALGQLMLETHDGLSKDYEVSCSELDFLVDSVRDLDSVLGARMMGGGFGGCTINIVKTAYIDELIKTVSAGYLQEFGLKLDAYAVETASGTSQIIEY